MANETKKPNPKLEQCDKVVKYGDFLSLIAFMVVWYTHDIYVATAALMAVMLPISFVAFLWYRAFPKMQIFMVGLVIVFGALTLALQDPIFIKIKPTIMLVGMGIAAFASVWMGKPAFAAMIPKQHLATTGITEEAIKPVMSSLTIRFGVMFVILGILNEIVWRTQTEEFWLWFKIFGSMGISVVFTAIQYPLMKRDIQKVHREAILQKKAMNPIFKLAMATNKKED